MSELFLGFFLLVIVLCLFEYRIQKRLDGLFRTLNKLEIEVVKLSGNEERVRCGIVACRAYRQSSSGSKVWRRKATMTASSSAESVVDCRSFGPMGCIS